MALARIDNSESESGSEIELGSGGQILETEANAGLLKLIHSNHSVLSPADLFKLAEFYQDYPTNKSLGNYLAFLALTTLKPILRIQDEAVKTGKISFFDLGQLWNEVNDQREDLFEREPPSGRSDDDDTDRVDRDEDAHEPRVLHALYKGVGFLIETRTTGSRKDKSRKETYFIIGVSPKPSSLHIQKEVLRKKI